MADVYLPQSLTVLFRGAPRRVQISAESVHDLLRALDQQWPGMWDRLCDAGPQIRPHMNVFVDGERGALETTLLPDSVVRIIPALSGG